MAIELNVDNVKTAVTAGADRAAEQGAAQGSTLAPVLGGKNVTVTSGATSDLEKLVARLKNESDDAKMSVSQRRISILQTVLDSMNTRITESQRDAILDIETLSSEKAGLEKALNAQTAGKAAAEGRVAVLDAQIAMLEKQIEQAVEDGADHREKVAKLKEQRAEEQAEIDRLGSAIASAAAKIASLDGRIAACTDAIGAATLGEVSAALRAAAGDVKADVERPESDADRRKAEAKAEATDIARTLREALDKIDEEIRQALDEAQMKIEG